MIIIENNKINYNIELSDNFFKLSLNSAKIASLAQPFQFITLNFNQSSLILPRPFSIYEKTANSITIIYKVIGTGTKFLTTLKKNDELLVKGPLGKTVKLPKKNL
ncbi:MAG: dihydroorotate dehydrogenase electron transfer subunit, partial [Candidatus Margulisiibacteriota bacterium]